MISRFPATALMLLVAISALGCTRGASVPSGEIVPDETPRELTIDDISPLAVNATPSAAMLRSSAGPVVAHIQILLDRAHFSPGIIDGRSNRNTELAIHWFQKSRNLPATSVVDSATYAGLLAVSGSAPLVTAFTVDADAIKGPFVTLPRSVYEQAKLKCLCYGSLTEKLAERFHTSLEVMRKLNPGVGFATLNPGDRIWVPAVESALPAAPANISSIRVSKKGSYVHAVARNGTVLYHFPSTLGSRYDPSPDGSFRVTAVAFDPVFRYDPTLFADVPDSKPKAKLPPGPNSPVGRVWIALSKAHVGIHGTPTPETIGSASSHGCVRLTNWDALKLARSSSSGTPVHFTD